MLFPLRYPYDDDRQGPGVVKFQNHYLTAEPTHCCHETHRRRYNWLLMSKRERGVPFICQDKPETSEHILCHGLSMFRKIQRILGEPFILCQKALSSLDPIILQDFSKGLKMPKNQLATRCS